MNKILIFVLMLILLSGTVLGLGVTPARTTMDFVPNHQESIDFTILNSEKKDLSLVLYARGDLESSISFVQDQISMTDLEESKTASYNINLPPNLSPGLHKTDIVVLENSPSAASGGQAHIGTVLGVATQLYVYVPYPGKYIDAELGIHGSPEKKQFIIGMVNRGKEDVNSVKAEIFIYDSSGNVVKDFETNEMSLAAGVKGELFYEWDVDISDGKYLAKAVLEYDGNEVLFEKEFEVGELILDLKQIFVENFVLGEVAEFNMIVENKWSEVITSAYAEMRVFDQDFSEIANFKSATYDIPPRSQETMIYYWDTQGIGADVYDANIIMHYAGKRTQQDLKLDVQPDKIEVIGLGYVISELPTRDSGSLVVILMTIIGVLVIANILWFLVFRKRMKKKRDDVSTEPEKSL